MEGTEGWAQKRAEASMCPVGIRPHLIGKFELVYERLDCQGDPASPEQPIRKNAGFVRNCVVKDSSQPLIGEVARVLPHISPAS